MPILMISNVSVLYRRIFFKDNFTNILLRNKKKITKTAETASEITVAQPTPETSILKK